MNQPPRDLSEFFKHLWIFGGGFLSCAGIALTLLLWLFPPSRFWDSEQTTSSDYYDENDRLREELSQRRRSNSELEDKNTALQRQINETQNALAQTEEKYAQLDAKFNDTEPALAQARDEIAQMNNTQAALARANSEIAQLNTTVIEQLSKIERLEANTEISTTASPTIPAYAQAVERTVGSERWPFAPDAALEQTWNGAESVRTIKSKECEFRIYSRLGMDSYRLPLFDELRVRISETDTRLIKVTGLSTEGCIFRVE